MKKTFLSVLVLVSLFLTVGTAQAADSFWNQCGGGSDSTIARCETYDCPQGDTNRDGRCNLNDTDAKLQEAKNDSFCANPISGCGEVLYYGAQSVNACAIRVKETKNNCDLYRAGDPNITPRPSATPTSSSIASSHFGDSTPSATPVTSTTKSLPKTGPALWISIAIAAAGVYGLYVSEKRN